MERFTTGDGIAIAYHQFPSSADDGRPLVVLQRGFAADSSLNWVRPGVVAALNAAGRSVIAVDARGHGHSDKPHDPSFYGEGRMSQDLTELIDSLGVRSFDLVGYSMGAIVAAITATRDPRVRRLVLGGIGASVAELGGVDSRRVASPALAAALRADDASAVTDPVTASFRRFADTTGADRRALAAQVERVHRTAIALGSIEAPTLVLVGDRDLLATRPEVLVAAIPGARLEVIPGDHLGAVGAPGFAPAIVRFLAAADARGR